MKHFVRFIALLFPLFQTTLSEEVYDSEAYKKLIHSLKYNETCSWRNEKLLLQLTKDWVTIKPGDFDKALKKHKDFAEKVIREQTHFCSTIDSLVCDRRTRRSRCGHSVRELFPRNATDLPDYVMEAGEDGKLRCHWAEGSYCFWKEEGRDDLDQHIKCQAGTTCLAVADLTPCTLQTARKYENPIGTSSRRFFRDVFLLKVCTCQHQGNSTLVTTLED